MVCCRIHLALPAFLSATRSTSAYATKTKIPAHILPATSSSRGQRFVHHQGATTTVRKPVSTASSSMTAENEFTSSLYDWEGQWSKGVGRGDMWDTGVASPALQDLLAKGSLPSAGRAFVPGCGRGYDALAFGRGGYECIGLDLSSTGIEEAKQLLAEQKEPINGKVDFRSGDFFKFKTEEQGKFDVILDYTFLCAIDPSAREAWADQMISLLAPKGELVTLIFPIVEKEGGPPYAMSEELVSSLLEPRGLEAVHLEKLPASLCHPGREGKTSLGRWRFPSSATANAEL